MSRQDDSIRHMLISTFHCAVCGEQLNVSYRPDKSPKEGSSEGQPTGAAMLQQRISIWPCRKCMQPAKDAAQAITTLMSLGAPKS